ncbi:MAG: ester cyclase [Candidatus Bathyarchaeota archaeon]|nr:ester cyclase [Candidatus Bathyarchaeota archaeon]
MSLEENKAIVRKFVEVVFGKRNWDLLDDLLAPDYVDPDYPQLQGREGLKQMMNMFLKAFSEACLQVWLSRPCCQGFFEV